MARCKCVAAGTVLMAARLAAAGGGPDNIFCAAGENPADKKNNAAHVAVASLLRNAFFITSRFQFTSVGAMLILFTTESRVAHTIKPLAGWCIGVPHRRNDAG